MSARDLVRQLGGRWHGTYGLAHCPAHDDRTPSLAVRDGADGMVLFHCHGGCQQGDVLLAFRERGLWSNSPPATTRCRTDIRSDEPEAGSNRAHALEIWQASQPAGGTLVERYLRARGITLPAPPSLRFNPALKYPISGIFLPAMVAAVTRERRLLAIQRIFLRSDGLGKAGVSTPKMSLGPIDDGAVALAASEPVLGLAEGVEDALSVMQLFGQPAWAVLGTRFDRVALPDIVRHVIIYADAGSPGLVAAHRAVEAFTRQRRKVTIEPPPKGYSDWNEVLQRRTAA